MICETAELWPLEAKDKATFNQTMKELSDMAAKDALERENTKQNTRRNNCGADRDCAERWYHEWRRRLRKCHGPAVASQMRQICDDQRVLWPMEIENTELFKKYRDDPRSGSLRQIQKENRETLAVRKACGSDGDCLRKWYAGNIARLKRALEGGGGGSPDEGRP